jgi:hypothetical protein
MGAPTILRNLRTHFDFDLRVMPREEENLNLATIALAFAFALSNRSSLWCDRHAPRAIKRLVGMAECLAHAPRLQ